MSEAQRRMEIVKRMAEAERRSAEDEAADARLQEFCDLLNKIEKRPDADLILERLRMVMESFLSLQIKTDLKPKKTSKPKPRKRVYWPRRIAC